MKSSLDVLRAVLADVSALPAEAPVLLPAGVVRAMVTDVQQLDAYQQRVAALDLRPNGGEEDVARLHDVEGGAV